MMFCTPIAYPLSAVPDRYLTLFALNPLTGVIESFRAVILQRPAPSPTLPVVAVVMSAALLPVAYALFKRAEATIADVI